MLKTPDITGYSADVKIDLFMKGQRFSVGQIGRDLLIFDEPTCLPDTTGELLLTIDGHERRWEITINSVQQPARIMHASFREIAQ